MQPANRVFRERGTHLTRLDGFSDVVFGFALTLLVVSLEVPKTFAELREVLGGFIAFAICFAFLIMVWHAHYKYFRRYGLEDTPTIALNAVLLFVVLFFVYPMKFLFAVLARQMTGQYAPADTPGTRAVFTSPAEVTQLMVLYGAGYAAVYLIFFFMYLRAWGQRGPLDLNKLERVMTVESMVDSGSNVLVGALCCAVAMLLPGERSGLSGLVFMLIGPLRTVRGFYFGKKRRQALEESPVSA